MRRGGSTTIDSCLVLLREAGSHTIGTSRASVRPGGSNTIGNWLDHHRSQSAVGTPRCLVLLRAACSNTIGKWLEHYRQLTRTPSASGSITIGTSRGLVRSGASATIG